VRVHFYAAGGRLLGTAYANHSGIAAIAASENLGPGAPVVDGLGVALVCIQALHRRVEELTAEVGRLREAASGNEPEAVP
jgi:hypothetical protein